MVRPSTPIPRFIIRPQDIMPQERRLHSGQASRSELPGAGTGVGIADGATATSTSMSTTITTKRTSTSKEATGNTIHNIAAMLLITGPQRARSKINWPRAVLELAIALPVALELETGPVAVLELAIGLAVVPE